MFFDVAKINVKGGDGGDGCMAMRREFRIEFGGPCGGNGGHGGSIYLECDESLNTLAMLRQKVHHRANDGTNGKGDSRHGRKGEDIVIPVPPGTIVRYSVLKIVIIQFEISLVYLSDIYLIRFVTKRTLASEMKTVFLLVS
jgi:Obg family GTPase CgtA